MRLLAAVLLWTLIGPDGDTIVQYQSEQECREDIVQGLRYLGDIPPKDQLWCDLRPDHNPVEACSDGSIAYLANGERCKTCLTKTQLKITSVLCEGHGYTPWTAEDRD